MCSPSQIPHEFLNTVSQFLQIFFLTWNGNVLEGITKVMLPGHLHNHDSESVQQFPGTLVVDTIGESFGIDSKESALPHTGSLTLPTVATIQASTSHVYCQTNLFRGHVDQLLNGQLILGGTQNYN